MCFIRRTAEDPKTDNEAPNWAWRAMRIASTRSRRSGKRIKRRGSFLPGLINSGEVVVKHFCVFVGRLRKAAPESLSSAQSFACFGCNFCSGQTSLQGVDMRQKWTEHIFLIGIFSSLRVNRAVLGAGAIPTDLCQRERRCCCRHPWLVQMNAQLANSG